MAPDNKTLLKPILKLLPKQLKTNPLKKVQGRLKKVAWILPILQALQAELTPEADADAPETAAPAEFRETITPIAPPGVQPAASPYKQYRCRLGDPLNCREPLATMQDGEKTCRLCSFPAALAENMEIWGRRGSYRVVRCLGRRGMGRLYEAVQIGTDQPMVVKEYLLPQRYFNAEETRQRKSAFTSLAGLSLADGRSQDLRVITPWEAIVEEEEGRCYLITTAPGASPTVNQFLNHTGPMPAVKVQAILNQTLQTLEFLHQQKFTLPMGQVQTGVFHGDINLDSLLVIRPGGMKWDDLDRVVAAWQPEDFIYLCDLSLWERVFVPPLVKVPTDSVAQDLAALGYVGFYLLHGQTIDAQGHPISPHEGKAWAEVYPPLKQFILQLMGLEQPFDSAAAARRALLQLPNPELANHLAPEETIDRQKNVWGKVFRIILLILALIVGCRMLWKFVAKPKVAVSAPPLCCINKVGAVPEGEFTYTSVENGVWNTLMQQTGLTGLQPEQKLGEYLATTQPNLKLNYQPVASVKAALARVRSGKAAFAVVPMVDELPSNFDYQEIAYDALSVFVAFSYVERNESLPVALKGQMTIEQLRQLFTGEVRDWQDLSQSFLANQADLAVNLYRPSHPELVSIFEQRVFNDPEAIETFQEQPAQSLPTMDMLRASIQDFETRQLGSVGFAPLSQVFGQCSVYPLAIGKNRDTIAQPLILEDGKAITPETDLCDRKGSYQVNADLIRNQQYPLTYSIAVVYIRDNSRPPVGEKFAEMLRSIEGQRLLMESGLVPRLREIPAASASNPPEKSAEKPKEETKKETKEQPKSKK